MKDLSKVLVAAAVASLVLQVSIAVRIVKRRQEVAEEVAVSPGGGGDVQAFSSAMTDGCKFEVKDPEKCAVDTARKCTKMCKAPVRWLPDYPCGLKPGCKVNCESVAECKDYHVLQGNQLIKDFLQNATHKAILSNLITNLLVDARKVVQQRLEVWKEDFKDMLVEKLGNDEVFGDYSILHGFVGNSSELVEALVPLSSFEASSGDGTQLSAVMEMPEARTYAEKRFSHTMENLSPVYRMGPALAIGALTAIKFPRVGLGIAAFGSGLLYGLTKLLADSIGPEIMGHTQVTVNAKLPEDVQKLGAPEKLGIKTWFNGTSMFASLQAVPMEMVQTLLTNVALEATENPEKVNKIPVKVVGAHFNLQAEGHSISVQPGSYGDIDATLDLSCMPNCPGPCGGIMRCG